MRNTNVEMMRSPERTILPALILTQQALERQYRYIPGTPFALAVLAAKSAYIAPGTGLLLFLHRAFDS